MQVTSYHGCSVLLLLYSCLVCTAADTNPTPVPDTERHNTVTQRHNVQLPPQDTNTLSFEYTMNYSARPLNASQYEVSASTGELAKYSLPEAVGIGVVLALICFFSVAGNVLVVVAILTDRNLRKTSNYFIISLALADMLVAIMVMTFAIANDILGYWIFMKEFCSVWISFDIMCSTASILNLCAISLDRYIHIKSPLHYETLVTPLRTCTAMSVVWLLSALISFLPIHLGWHQMGMETPSVNPYDDHGHYICLMELNPIYAVISSMISFYVPCIVMLLIYLRLFMFARRQVKNIKRTTRVPATYDFASQKQKQNQHKVSDHKAAITLGVIMGTFLFCWTPFFTINIVGSFCPTCIPTVVFSVFTWLGYFNSTLNPVIYSIFNREFRDAFKRVLSYLQCFKLKDVEFRRPIRFMHLPTKNSAYGTVAEKPTQSLSTDMNQITSV